MTEKRPQSLSLEEKYRHLEPDDFTESRKAVIAQLDDLGLTDKSIQLVSTSLFLKNIFHSGSPQERLSSAGEINESAANQTTEILRDQTIRTEVVIATQAIETLLEWNPGSESSQALTDAKVELLYDTLEGLNLALQYLDR